jgi:hypothetical protein
LRKKPTQTELDYRTEKIDTIDDAEGIMYEGVTFRLASGHRYTPDWVYWLPLHRLHAEMYCVEVKGQYRLPSYQRARLAFDQAAIEYPAVTFLWAERQPDKSWKVTKGGVE